MWIESVMLITSRYRVTMRLTTEQRRLLKGIWIRFLGIKLESKIELFYYSRGLSFLHILAIKIILISLIVTGFYEDLL